MFTLLICVFLFNMQTYAINQIVASKDTTNQDATGQEINILSEIELDKMREEADKRMEEDLRKIKIEETKKIAQLKEKNESQLIELKNFLHLNGTDLNNLRNNLGLSEQKHDESQNQIEKDLDKLQRDINIKDEDKLAEIVKKLFYLKEINFRDDKDYDFTIFMANKDKLSISQQFFIDNTRLSKWIEKELMKDPKYI